MLHRPTRAILAGFALFALAGCGASENDRGPGSVTEGEAAALNDAAAMLDANAVSAEALEQENAR